MLRAIERTLGDNFVRREKREDRRWAVFGRSGKGDDVLVALVGGGSTRRLEDVRAPVPVEILEPSFINLDAFRRAVGADLPNVQEKL
ncbi:MAG: hypothetical protein KF764_00955 [Labilithrix sp.]|nr:hypothetical protein [Labilithrix sp.]